MTDALLKLRGGRQADGGQIQPLKSTWGWYNLHQVRAAKLTVSSAMLISESEADRRVSPMSIGQLLFSFRGRINRMRYWLVSLAMLLVMAVAFALMVASGVWEPAILFPLLLIPSIWIGMAVAAKRLHDRNKSAWWLVVFYVLPGVLDGIGGLAPDAEIALLVASTAISIWALVELGFLRGTPGPNDYGPDPLAGA